MVRNLLIVWLINALALLALPYLVPSVQVESFYTALIAALLLGLVNSLVRPLLVLLTLPVTVVTLGLFVFVINALAKDVPMARTFIGVMPFFFAELLRVGLIVAFPALSLWLPKILAG